MIRTSKAEILALILLFQLTQLFLIMVPIEELDPASHFWFKVGKIVISLALYSVMALVLIKFNRWRTLQQATDRSHVLELGN